VQASVICPVATSSARRWTLARIAQVLRERFGVDHTLAGLDLLLHRMG